MRRLVASFSLALFLVLIGNGVLHAQSQPLRTWKDTGGRTLEARFAGVENDNVLLLDKSDNELSVAMEKFSEADQVFVCDTLLETAIIHYGNEDFDAATKQLDSILGLRPKFAPAHLWKGKLHLKLESWESARFAFKEYSALNPDDAEGPRGVAIAYQQEDKSELALFWYKKAIEIDPNDAQSKAAIEELTKVDAPVEGDASDSGADDSATASDGEEPAPNNTPSTPPNNAATDKPAEASEEPVRAIWQQGLIGLCGGRSVWWGRLIGIVFYAFLIIGGGVNIGFIYKKIYSKEIVATVSLFGGMFGGAFSYALYWGVPIDCWGWGLAGVTSFLIGVIAAGAAAAEEQA